MTPLHAAAQSGHLDVCRALLDADGKVRINQATNNAHGGSTALLLAAEAGHAEVCRMLLTKGRAGVNVPSKMNGQTPLHHAVDRGHTEVVRVLLRDGRADVNLATGPKGASPLELACRRDNVGICRILVEEGKADVNKPVAGKHTLLIHAVLYKATKIIAWLLKQGKADPNTLSAKGEAPLHVCAHLDDHIEGVRLLLADSRTDVDLPSRLTGEAKGKPFDGATPLMMAAGSGCVNVARMLFTKGKADIHRVTPGGMTAMAMASDNNHPAFCKLLIDSGVDVNHAHVDGATALHLAAVNGSFEVCRVLVVHGKADTSLRDETGRTALHVAAAKGHLRACKVLLEEGRSDPNVVALGGFTPLHSAVIGGHTPVAQLLLHHGARDEDINVLGHMVSTSDIARDPETVAYLDRKRCTYCDKVTDAKMCARCKKVQYCSRECQKQHWKAHKPDCKAA